MGKVVTAFDVLAFYVGVEHYSTYDEEEDNILEIKEISLYSQNVCFKSDNITRQKLVNMATGDVIEINQHGDCIRYDSLDREIYDITCLHSFRDCVKELLKTTRETINDIENGKETNEWWEALDALMDAGVKIHQPVLMQYDTVMNIVDAISNVYSLAYGNPLLNESKEKCLLKFINFNKDKE